MINLLREYSNIFAWSNQNMLRLNTDIVVHYEDGMQPSKTKAT